MAKYVLETGERELGRARARNTREGPAGYLALTERRVVLIEGRSMTEAIARPDFVRAEVTGAGRLTVHSRRKGYSFEVKIRAPEKWVARLAAWIEDG